MAVAPYKQPRGVVNTTDGCRHTLGVATLDPKPVDISVDDATVVSGLLVVPPAAKACFVMAHGAGAGMLHPFMVSLVNDLAARGIATLRYQFPYMKSAASGRTRPPFATPRCAPR